jgi:hypothetical protein
MKEFLKSFRNELFAVMDEKDLMPEDLPPFTETLKQIEGGTGEILGHDSYC